MWKKASPTGSVPDAFHSDCVNFWFCPLQCKAMTDAFFVCLKKMQIQIKGSQCISFFLEHVGSKVWVSLCDATTLESQARLPRHEEPKAFCFEKMKCFQQNNLTPEQCKISFLGLSENMFCKDEKGMLGRHYSCSEKWHKLNTNPELRMSF